MREELEVVGPRLKVLVPNSGENKSSGGILLDLGDKAEDLETGIVIGVPQDAYAEFDIRWCDLGDKILFQRYAGKAHEETDSNGKIRFFRIIKDKDVIGVFKQIEDKKDE